MSFWKRDHIEPAEIVCDEEGLGRLIQELCWDGSLVTMATGIYVNVFAQSRGTFLVKLDKGQTRYLSGKLPNWSLQDRYGTDK